MKLYKAWLKSKSQRKHQVFVKFSSEIFDLLKRGARRNAVSIADYTHFLVVEALKIEFGGENAQEEENHQNEKNQEESA